MYHLLYHSSPRNLIRLFSHLKGFFFFHKIPLLSSAEPGSDTHKKGRGSHARHHHHSPIPTLPLRLRRQKVLLPPRLTVCMLCVQCHFWIEAFTCWCPTFQPTLSLPMVSTKPGVRRGKSGNGGGLGS